MVIEAILLYLLGGSVMYYLYTSAPPQAISCDKCETTLEEYYSAEGEKTVIGLICFPCKREWIVEHLARSSDRLHPSNVRIMNGIRYYQRQTTHQRQEATEEPLARSDINVLRRGDHVMWKRKLGLYYYHAIVVGLDRDQFNIIEFSKHKRAALQKVKIQKHTKRFSEEKATMYRLVYDEEKACKDDVQIVIARAYYLLNKRENIWYNLLKYNCESLSMFCVCGTAITYQGQRVRNVLEWIPLGNRIDNVLYFSTLMMPY